MHFLAFSVQWNDEIKSIMVHKHIYIYMRNQYKAIFMHVNCVFLKRCINETGISLFDSDSLHDPLENKYSLLMHCIKIKSPAKFLLNEQYVFVGGNISFLCVLSCSSEEA